MDAAYISARLYTEFQNYRNLWSESDAAFYVANKSIDQGVLPPVAWQGNRSSFSLFPSAVVASLPAADALGGIPVINSGELLLQNGNLPAVSLNTKALDP